MAWLQCSDTKDGATRWVQLEEAPHILPYPGEHIDAIDVLSRVGKYTATGMGSVSPIKAGDILDFVIATGRTISPQQVDAALIASKAYVDEYFRSNHESTDAPWDWPKSQRDLDIFAKEAERAMKAIIGVDDA